MIDDGGRQNRGLICFSGWLYLSVNPSCRDSRQISSVDSSCCDGI